MKVVLFQETLLPILIPAVMFGVAAIGVLIAAPFVPEGARKAMLIGASIGGLVAGGTIFGIFWFGDRMVRFDRVARAVEIYKNRITGTADETYPIASFKSVRLTQVRLTRVTGTKIEVWADSSVVEIARIAKHATALQVAQLVATETGLKIEDLSGRRP